MDVAAANGLPGIGLGNIGGVNQPVGQDDFLMLLISQMQHQDPLEPADSSEFMAQLAQFSQLEQLFDVNGNLETLQIFQSSMNNAQAVGLIGKVVTVEGSSVNLSGGLADTVEFNLMGDAAEVTVKVYNQQGKLVKTFDAGAMTSGVHEFAWDGRDGQGNYLPDGSYSFSVVARDDSGNMVNTDTMVEGVVTGVNFSGDLIKIQVGNHEYNLSQVIEVRQEGGGNTSG